MAIARKSFPELSRDFAWLKRERVRVLTDFLEVDLDTSITFAAAALEATNSEEKQRRNRVNARRGYDAVMHFMRRIEIAAARKRELNVKLRKLRLMLQEAGEHFPR